MRNIIICLAATVILPVLWIVGCNQNIDAKRQPYYSHNKIGDKRKAKTKYQKKIVVPELTKKEIKKVKPSKIEQDDKDTNDRVLAMLDREAKIKIKNKSEGLFTLPKNYDQNENFDIWSKKLPNDTNDLVVINPQTELLAMAAAVDWENENVSNLPSNLLIPGLFLEADQELYKSRPINNTVDLINKKNNADVIEQKDEWVKSFKKDILANELDAANNFLYATENNSKNIQISEGKVEKEQVKTKNINEKKLLDVKSIDELLASIPSLEELEKQPLDNEEKKIDLENQNVVVSGNKKVSINNDAKIDKNIDTDVFKDLNDLFIDMMAELDDGNQIVTTNNLNEKDKENNSDINQEKNENKNTKSNREDEAKVIKNKQSEKKEILDEPDVIPIVGIENIPETYLEIGNEKNPEPESSGFFYKQKNIEKKRKENIKKASQKIEENSKKMIQQAKEETLTLKNEYIKYPKDWNLNKIEKNKVTKKKNPFDENVKNKVNTKSIKVEGYESSIKEIANSIGRKTGLAIIVDKNVEDKYKIIIPSREMTIKEILDWVKELTGVSYKIKNGAVWIYDNKNDDMVVRVYDIGEIEFARSLRDAGNRLTNLLGDDVDDDDYSKQKEMDKELRDDHGTIIEQIKETIFPETWENGAGIEEWDGNLIVKQTEEIQEVIADYLEKRRTFLNQQVLVETRFIAVSNEAKKQLGFSWNFGDSKVGSTPESGYGVSMGGGIEEGNKEDYTELNVGYKTNYLANKILKTLEVRAVLKSLKEQNLITELHCPRLIALNGRQARAEVIERYQLPGDKEWVDLPKMSNSNNSPGESPHPGKIAERGVTLIVRPVITADRKHIVLETKTRLGNMIAEHLVTVPDGGTTIGGGVLSDLYVDHTSGIPGLSSIPFFNKLFTSKNNENTTRQLLMVFHAQIMTIM